VVIIALTFIIIRELTAGPRDSTITTIVVTTTTGTYVCRSSIGKESEEKYSPSLSVLLSSYFLFLLTPVLPISPLALHLIFIITPGYR